MRIFGMEIPDKEVPEGSFKQFMLGDDSLSAPPVTKVEKDWIKKVLESRKRQLLARVPFSELRYEG